MTGAQHKIVGTGFGIAAAYAGYRAGSPDATIMIVTSMIGCMLPDIDHDKTKIGRKRKAVTQTTTSLTNMLLYGGVFLGTILAVLMVMGFVDYGIDLQKLVFGIGGLGLVILVKSAVSNSDMYRWATKHRGLMHTLVVPALLWYATTISSAPLYYYAVTGLLVGYVSHLFADMLTVEGCPVLFPLSRSNFRFLKLRTKDSSTTIAAWVVAVGVIALAYYFC